MLADLTFLFRPLLDCHLVHDGLKTFRQCYCQCQVWLEGNY